MNKLLILAVLFLTGCAADHHDFSAFPQWKRIVDDMAATQPAAPIAEEQKAAALHSVWRQFENVQYATDETIYGRSDHWAEPKEMLAAGKGDCEDFAIGQYFYLRNEKHFKDEDLAIMVGKRYEDMEMHALLLARVNGEWRVLDCNHPGVEFADSYLSKFKEMYQLNVKEWRQ